MSNANEVRINKRLQRLEDKVFGEDCPDIDADKPAGLPMHEPGGEIAEHKRKQEKLAAAQAESDGEPATKDEGEEPVTADGDGSPETGEPQSREGDDNPDNVTPPGNPPSGLTA